MCAHSLQLWPYPTSPFVSSRCADSVLPESVGSDESCMCLGVGLRTGSKSSMASFEEEGGGGAAPPHSSTQREGKSGGPTLKAPRETLFSDTDVLYTSTVTTVSVCSSSIPARK